ncbi:GntR family transcriptional regulator [Devosia sp. 63-57]|uniref:GntR family transcriptional regulator n=1 Tax=Devosia sp. 63-57 TaxID=1895751 RepID=UPI00086A8E8A|nr:GntR family transcriptional regulator [Devosia sp. 63-57]ODT48938.1 MAG: GntR family transcriptional regulator [Pelagibacterium sp. SCN 63-126]ODU89331.1 MAG: GntR family transcriptional regulator [Pelagibacterium sp. SCN 63-17]OJX44132.1 MAG: GntR family transcriptional regulator [Devosia sp. 63-57]
MDDFNASQPIFVQIRQRLIDMILRRAVVEGDPLPSVRQIAADLSVNPLTVTKAFEALVEIGVVEKRRGLGMFVTQGARATLLAHEREKFLKQDWPRIAAQIKALELDVSSLLQEPQADTQPGNSQK